MSDPRKAAQEAFAKLKPDIQTQHRAAWERCESAVKTLIPKGAKVFEARHVIEHARGIYLAELAAYHAADHCERAVMRAYGLGEKS